MFFYVNEIVPLLWVELPFVDEDSVSGFVILSVFHVICLTFGFLASASMDFAFAMKICNMLLISYIFDNSIADLNVELIKPKRNLRAIKGRVRNIFLQHRECYE